MAPAPACADACVADGRASYARVQRFRDGACTGASVNLGFTGSGDRPDFAAFTNHEGNVYDIDDTRDSVAAAPATCVRLFDGRNYTGESSGLLCAAPSADGLFADLGAMANRASSMRVCPASAPAGCDATAAPPPSTPAPIPNGDPASPRARLSATLTRGRARAIACGPGDPSRQGDHAAGARARPLARLQEHPHPPRRPLSPRATGSAAERAAPSPSAPSRAPTRRIHTRPAARTPSASA